MIYIYGNNHGIIWYLRIWDANLHEFAISSPFPDFNPDREDNHDGEPSDKGTEHKDIAIVSVSRETKDDRDTESYYPLLV